MPNARFMKSSQGLNEEQGDDFSNKITSIFMLSWKFILKIIFAKSSLAGGEVSKLANFLNFK